MAEFGVGQPVQDGSVDNNPCTDTGSDRDVCVMVEPHRFTPHPFCEGGSVDIGVNGNWQLEAISDRSHEVESGPSGLWSRQNRPEIGMTRPQFEGTKGSDADRVKVVRAEKSDNRLHQLPWFVTRLQPHRLAKLAIAVPGCDKRLGPAELDSPVQIHHMILVDSALPRQLQMPGTTMLSSGHALAPI
jgi:hypothetical protein